MEALTLEAKLMNNEKFMKMFNEFPAAMRRGWLRFLYSTRKSYLGNKSTDGIFRRRTQQLRRGQGSTGIFGGRTGNWPKNMVNAWKGKVSTYGNSADTAFLQMGTGYKSQKPFMQGLYGMEKSTPEMTVSSSDNMIFPVYKNLARRGRLVSPMHVKNKNMMLDTSIKDDALVWVKKNGKTYVLDEMDQYKSGAKKGKLKPSALLFVLGKKFKMPKKIDFFGLWATQENKTLRRMNNILKQTIRGIEKGYIPV